MISVSIIWSTSITRPRPASTCRAAVRGDPGAPDQKGSHLHSRQSGRQPRRPAAHRRRDGDDRLHIAGSARCRFRARSSLRNLRSQHQSDADGRAPVGGHRSRGQGVDQPRRAVQLRRPLHAPARCEHVAAALSIAPSAGLDHRLERLQLDQEGRRPRLRVRNLSATAREGEGAVRRLSQRLSRSGPARRRRHRVHAAGLYRGKRGRSRGRGARAASGT